ncbi:putative LRR receptor-like serine/threonine-protein kinase [Panicum miliaceum]|uniref:LRR receptor-like serine/threonine-protein kinase n=1 Tax=Panicum miliaceum TaxID=4540 RepID=A0A3L6SXX3_PANMI|nr:putative LRR receptor-like serine/threonine-protein kinase [Panicum miliaceum]
MQLCVYNIAHHKIVGSSNNSDDAIRGSGRPGMPEEHARGEGSKDLANITRPFSRASKPMSILPLLLVGTLLSIGHTTHAAPTSSPPAAQIAMDEHALLSFRALLTGDPHRVLISWTAGNGSTAANTTSGVCSWRGVGCHSRRHPGYVTSLELWSSNLTGTISPFLSNLTFLRTLNLSHNSFSGSIPWELGFLPHLLYLDLRHDSFQGMIPGSLARASKLRILQLEYNSLVGTIPANLSNLQELEVLDVGSNQLSGGIPPSLGSLSKLTYLGLYLNNLSGGVPASLGNLSSLVDLFADTNKLSGQIPDSLGRLTKLKSLDLAYNQLSGTIPASLFNISSVSTFELSGNNALSGVLPFDIGVTLPNLRNLILNDCQLSGRIPRSIGNASLLRYIQLDDNELEGTVPLEVGNLRDLEVLTLGNNQLADEWGSDWELMASLSNCSKLFSLSLDSNNFQGVLPPSIVNLSNTMQKLHLAHNKFHGSISSDIWKLSNLAILSLRGNFLSGSIPPRTGDLYKLGALDLSQNNISGEIPPTLGNLTGLSMLYLFQNNLQGSIPTSLGNLQNIASLVLSFNQLNGTIPIEVISLSSLTSYLGLSYNFLSGPIPSEVGKLTNLVLLDLSVNKLTGEYGMDGNVSSQGDAYSYGVLLLELFTGKRPTDGSFQGGQTLQSYVAACYPDKIMEIVDPTLLPLDNGCLSKGSISCDDIDAEKLQECTVPIFRVGLQCSQESSRARMHIKDTIRELEAVKDVLLNY